MSKYLRLASGPILTIIFGTIIVSLAAGLVNITSLTLTLGLGTIIGILAHIIAYTIASIFNPYRTDNPVQFPSFRLIDLDVLFNPREGVPRWIREQAQWASIVVVAIPFILVLHPVFSKLETAFGLSSSIMNMYYILLIIFGFWMGERLVCQYGSRLFTEEHSKPIES